MFYVIDVRSACRTIVSKHRSLETAERAVATLARPVCHLMPLALIHLMWIVRELTPAEAREYPRAQK